jgi:hypothetical protein
MFAVLPSNDAEYAYGVPLRRAAARNRKLETLACEPFGNSQKVFDCDPSPRECPASGTAYPEGRLQPDP